ncbi:MAG: acetyl-CoA hydrolase [Thermoplasmata archaeon HGW-Thermoplasmata-1]|nr:MAG: acetyl-CoA hydrolase [Thermoplasmata archaeon HGW-Thermoplasmata-1]
MNKSNETTDRLDEMRQRYPEKFVSEDKIFANIHRGDRIFIHTACGEPQYLVSALVRYVESNPKAFFDTEIYHVWTLGVAPYTDEKFKSNFRSNSFFIGNNARKAVNEGLADYTPVFLSKVPDLFRRGLVPLEVALIQTSPPDEHGYMSLGISIDIVKAALENASLVIAQVNSNMPRTHGDGFIHIGDIDFVVPHDEPLLEYGDSISDGISQKIGEYVSHIVQDGDTIQVGYGSIPNAILTHLSNKKDLGVHTELISDGIVDLIKKGVITNKKKTLNKGKTVASFCMGHKETYDFINDNPSIEFRVVDYTNNPSIIAQHEKMVAINSALEIDLTGQSTAESLGTTFYSGIGGQADFMRGAVFAKYGKTILAMQSTAENGTISRIVPMLSQGAGVSLLRGDLQYVVTENGIAYLHGKNIRERAMQLISIAHPKFKPWLLQEAKKLNLIYRDQAFIEGKKGEYPEYLETYRTTKTGIEILLRPVRISDEPLVKDLFYSLSDRSMYRRFISVRKDMPHERLQDFVVIDYTKEMVILAVLEEGEKTTILGIGQYGIDEISHTSEISFVIRESYQGNGVGTELINYLTLLAKKQGLHGFTAEVLAENRPMLALFEKMDFDMEKKLIGGVYELKMMFRRRTE